MLSALQTRLVDGSVRFKRRTISGQTARGTWLRIEARPEHRVAVQGWGGVEAAAALTGVAKPAWYRALSWRDPMHTVWWRADETQLITDPTVALSAQLSADPGLSPAWWSELGASLAALAAQPAGHFAKLDSGTTAPKHLTGLVARTVQLLDAEPVDPTVTEWTTAHADLSWANLTAPRCWLLDWEDWGRAPRGFDAATLLLMSVGFPALVDRVRAMFAAELASRPAQIAILARAADPLSGPDPTKPPSDAIRREARRAVALLNGS